MMKDSGGGEVSLFRVAHRAEAATGITRVLGMVRVSGS